MKKVSDETAPHDEAFDCLEFKRRVQAEVYEEIRDMSWQERIAHLHLLVASGPFGRWWQELEKHPQVAPGSRADRRI